MNAYADFAADFSHALRLPEIESPPGLMTWNSSDPAKRFAVYRNNVIVSLVDALADSYPVVQALVGEEFFRAMAGEFVRRSPPRSPVLAWYGDGFADFIAGFEPVVGLSYLTDVARLEWLRVESWHAADGMALPRNVLAALLADTARLPETRFVLHPAVHVMRSVHPVVSLWAAHQEDHPDVALAGIDMTHAEAALLMRPDLGVEIIPVESGAAEFVGSLQSGLPFAAAIDTDAPFDLPATLGLLISKGALVGILSQEYAS